MFARCLSSSRRRIWPISANKMVPKPITSYFKPATDKRKAAIGEDSPSKKVKVQSYDNKQTSDCSHPADSLGGDKPSSVSSPVRNSPAKTLIFKNPKILNGEFGSSWHSAIKPEFAKPYFSKLKDFIETERKRYVIYPPEPEVFSWTLHCSINQVKVVILGQDPYHGPNQAHGLAFSVKRGVAKPPSLQNMFKEIKNEYPEFEIPSHGELTGWAQQGVLLLNACLTVRQHQANSHANKGWEEFTDAVIKYLANNTANRVFMLWGAYAQKKGYFIDSKKHLVLKTVHPSPLSANRGFLGCGHFKKANDYLKQHGKTEVRWTELN